MKKFKTKPFARFAEQKALTDDQLKEAVQIVDSGHAEASYGNFLYKVRIARAGKGKSGGFRTLLCVKKGDIAFFMYGFAKSDKSTITQKEEKVYKNLSKYYASLSDKQIQQFVDSGDLIEIV